ncbi:DUF4861 family protein [Massilia endophytica]|uniref:DUF4861 family protein n=1 Tax=Massilia endophytica TaxID=2899220 RepID=UPI001E623E53|nr:DUF4861 family protein [Massilia endophytica]UGQ49140.1 DUF4861 domain-containing protein [Massilia endophytica]
MKLRLLAACLGIAALNAAAAERMVITVQHELKAARPAETITVPWAEVNRRLPGALLQQIAVRDANGRSLPYQVTNVAPQAKDPKGEGIAYGELIFQHDFASGEQSARFTVEKTGTVSPPFPTKVAARYVPERLDDFAWENDKIAHRTYGQALAAPAPPGSGKEVLVTSGVDIWFKRPSYPIIDRWYNKGHDHYHKDEGEGLDMYGVGRTRGAGGTGIWNGSQLFTSRNYSGWRVIANGPIRAVFELTYDTWDAGGVPVSEVKRFTVDAGRYFDTVESTFAFPGGQPLTVALGLNKKPAYPEQTPTVTAYRMPEVLAQWVRQRSAGDFGVAIILPGAQGYAADADNELVLAKAVSGRPLRYYLGAAASWSGEFPDAAAWQAYIKAEQARIASPVRVAIE